MSESVEAREIDEQWLALGRDLQQLRKRRGIAQALVGKRARMHRSMVSRIESGLVRGNRPFWEVADDCVRAEGALVARFDELARLQEMLDATVVAGLTAPGVVVVVPGSARSYLPVVSSPVDPAGSTGRAPRVRDELLVHVEATTRAHRYFDYQEGAASVGQEATAHLNRLLGLADAVPTNLHKRYQLAVGDAAQLAAWLAIDRQDYVVAKHLCGIALAHAVEVDTDLVAYVMGIQGYMHLHHGRGQDALDVLSGAIHTANGGRRRANAAVSSWLYEALGEAYAITGERARGAKALLQAETLFDTVTTVPAWLGFFDSAAHLTRLKGRCLTRLGDGRHATAALSQALTMLPAHYVREQSGTLIDLAAAYLLPGVLDPAAAAHAASQAHDLAVLTKSARNLKRVRTLMPTFHRYRTIPEVRTLITAVG